MVADLPAPGTPVMQDVRVDDQAAAQPFDRVGGERPAGQAVDADVGAGRGHAGPVQPRVQALHLPGRPAEDRHRRQPGRPPGVGPGPASPGRNRFGSARAHILFSYLIFLADASGAGRPGRSGHLAHVRGEVEDLQCGRGAAGHRHHRRFGRPNPSGSAPMANPASWANHMRRISIRAAAASASRAAQASSSCAWPVTVTVT